METQREERQDERLVSSGDGGDELLQSYCLLIAEFVAFIINRGRSIFWIERFTHLLATAYFQSGKWLTLASLLFCFTHTVFIIKFVHWIYKSMDNETQPKQEPLLKAGIVEENLQAEKVEPNQEPLKAEILEEDRLPKERVELDLQPLEAERVEEDKLPKEKVELDQELLMEGGIVEEDELPKENVEFQEPLEGEIVAVAQEPSKIDLFEEDKLPKEEVELDEEALKFVMLDYELLKLELEYDNYLDTLYLEELRRLAAVPRDRDQLVKEPKEEPLKFDLEDKSPSMKEANGERNEALLELNDVYEDDDVDEDDDSDEDNEDSTDDEDKDSDDDDDDKEGEDDKDEEKEEYEYPKLKAADCYKFSAEIEFENRFKNQLIIDYKEQCLILEEEKKDLTAKLAAASESLELYLQKEKDYLEDRNNWFIKRQNLSLKLDDTQACLEDNVNESRKLREERDDLSSKLSAQTSYAEYYHKLFQETEEKNKKLVEEMEETNRKLEEEENDLVAKLCAAKALAELYRSYLHDCEF